jgi:L-aminopeptidase/D-esterase-like protein
MVPGPANLLTDVAGLKVGHASNARLKSGVTVILCEEPALAAVHVMGGAPGTRETDLLAPEQTVERIDAIALSGGSAFGLDAASGVMEGLAAMGRGFAVGSVRVPLVPAAILFDLLNGGDKDWAGKSPYHGLGRTALAAAGKTFELGSVGAGTGATTANLKGGLGSASMRLDDGTTVAALVAANALGQATIGDTAHFWAAPFEHHAEFGGLGLPSPFPADAATLRLKRAREPGQNTTLAVVATDAVLTKAEAKRLAIVAHDGFARAIWPAHTQMDGDIVFALSTGRSEIRPGNLIALGAAAAACTARAIARGVYEATDTASDLVPSWRTKFGR